MENEFDPKHMSERERLDWIEEKKKLPEWLIQKAQRPLLDQLTEDQARIKQGRKMSYEDLLHSDKIIGGVRFIRSNTEPESISRHDAYMLCKQLLTALRVGRFCAIDHDDVEWALALVEMRLGAFARHLSKSSEMS